MDKHLITLSVAAPEVPVTVCHEPAHSYNLLLMKVRIMLLMGPSTNVWLTKSKAIFTMLYWRFILKCKQVPLFYVCINLLRTLFYVNKECFSSIFFYSQWCDISLSGRCCLLLVFIMIRKDWTDCINSTQVLGSLQKHPRFPTILVTIPVSSWRWVKLRREWPWISDIETLGEDIANRWGYSWVTMKVPEFWKELGVKILTCKDLPMCYF